MNARIIAAIFAAAALPVAAQNSTPRVEQRTAAQEQRVPAKAAKKVETPRERAKIAKAKKKQSRKKASAT